MFAVLAYPAFRYIWLGAMVSNIGNWMETVAQSWLVQEQSGSPFLVELLAASEFVPVAVLTLWAGKMADRHDRRKLLLAGQIAMMVLAAVLALVTHLHLATPWVVIALAFAEGAAWASVTPSWQALVPALVPRDELPSAIALNSAQFNSARLLGPMLAGALLSASGPALVFDLNVVSFIAIVVALYRVRVPAAQLQASKTNAGELRKVDPEQGGSGGIIEALRWARRMRGPRRILLSLFTFALLTAPVQGLLPVYAADLLRVGAAGYGVLLSCLGAGAICGALSLAQLPRSYPRHHLIPLSMLGFSICALIYGSSRNLLLSCAALAVGGVFWVWSLAAANTAMQLLVPERLRGRAMSVLSVATMGPLPLGHVLAGTIAHAFGARVAVIGMTGLLACFSLWSAWAREPAIDAPLAARPPPQRGLRAALWEAFTGTSHRAQEVEPGLPHGSAEPIEE
jgi:MFS family permease